MNESFYKLVQNYKKSLELLYEAVSALESGVDDIVTIYDSENQKSAESDLQEGGENG